MFIKPNNLKNETLKNLTIAEQVKKLADGIEMVSSELQKQVLEKHNDLIRQATHANKLDNILNIMNVHMQNLFANAERLKAQVMLNLFILWLLIVDYFRLWFLTKR